MSKGSVLIHVRVPADQMADLQKAYLRWQQNSEATDTSMSDFIRTAIKEKIDHGKRSRQSRKKKDDVVQRQLEEFAKSQGITLDEPTMLPE